MTAGDDDVLPAPRSGTKRVIVFVLLIAIAGAWAVDRWQLKRKSTDLVEAATYGKDLVEAATYGKQVLYNELAKPEAIGTHISEYPQVPKFAKLVEKGRTFSAELGMTDHVKSVSEFVGYFLEFPNIDDKSEEGILGYWLWTADDRIAWVKTEFTTYWKRLLYDRLKRPDAIGKHISEFPQLLEFPKLTEGHVDMPWILEKMPESQRTASNYVGYFVEYFPPVTEGIGGYWVWTGDDHIALVDFVDYLD